MVFYVLVSHSCHYTNARRGVDRICHHRIRLFMTQEQTVGVCSGRMFFIILFSPFAFFCSPCTVFFFQLALAGLCSCQVSPYSSTATPPTPSLGPGARSVDTTQELLLRPYLSRVHPRVFPGSSVDFYGFFGFSGNYRYSCCYLHGCVFALFSV